MTWRERLEMKATDYRIFHNSYIGSICADNVNLHLTGLAEVLERVESLLISISEDPGAYIDAPDILAELQRWREQE